MNSLGQIVSAVEQYRKFVSSQVRTARDDPFTHYARGESRKGHIIVPIARLRVTVDLRKTTVPQRGRAGRLSYLGRRSDKSRVAAAIAPSYAVRLLPFGPRGMML